MAKTKLTTVHHLTAKRFVGITPGHQRVMIDGEDHASTGMDPMELLLNALGSCTAFDVVEMIRKRRVELASYRVELVGHQREESPSAYTAIDVTHVIDAPGLSQPMAERFVDLAMTKHCSVAASLSATISSAVRLVHTDGEEAAAG